MLIGVGLLLASQACAVKKEEAVVVPKDKDVIKEEAVVVKQEDIAIKEEAANDNGLKTDREKLSYSIGLQLGTSLKEIKEDIDFSVAVQGIEDSFNDKKLLLTQEEIMKELTAFSKKMQEKQMKIMEEQKKKMDVLGKENKELGEAFLAENKKKENVITTKSGLQYIVLSKGEGEKPKATDQVKVHYKGTLIDGTEFDSSYKRGEPVTFPANRVIPGWTEALQLMNVGSKYQLFIPSDLAYGERAAGPQIGPNATLIFEVELLSIEKIPEPEPAKKPEKKE
ncbi:FKBP-type peptidyl-prolyl cis-trans isomerase [bacterium]|nr:FKBP-type peptidyl-prolyl cis-trans isomerase [bacterium]